MSRTSNSSDTELATSARAPTGQFSRQQAGAACDECRRRKLRCDRKQPQCGICAESGITCNVSKTYVPRGPKRGHLRSLQTKIASLENQLLEQQNRFFAKEQSTSSSNNNVPIATPSSTECSLRQGGTSASDFEPNFEDRPPETPSSSSLPSSSISITDIDDLTCADLEQMYFDRVHVLIPILHKRRYFSWARTEEKTESQACLQYAMWTSAASLSTQFHSIRDSLYKASRQMLAQFDSNAKGLENVQIEQVQARILCAVYDFMKSSYQSAWMTAGYCFRLVQLMRLYEVDAHDGDISHSEIEQDADDWILTEEKRRTFWMAYLLDRFASMSDSWPLTLSEHVILTRLPAPELNFQCSQPIQVSFLSQAVTDDATTSTRTPFVELINLATICGRVVSHQQSSSVERVYGDGCEGFWKRHEWLDFLLLTRIQVLSRDYPLISDYVDPLLLFAHMIAHTIVLHLYKTIQTLPTNTVEHSQRVGKYEQRAVAATQEIASLIKSMAQLSCFKVHPFTPIPLLQCAEFLARQLPPGSRNADFLKNILDAVLELKNVNNLAQRNYDLPSHARSSR